MLYIDLSECSYEGIFGKINCQSADRGVCKAILFFILRKSLYTHHVLDLFSRGLKMQRLFCRTMLRFPRHRTAHCCIVSLSPAFSVTDLLNLGEISSYTPLSLSLSTTPFLESTAAAASIVPKLKVLHARIWVKGGLHFGRPRER